MLDEGRFVDIQAPRKSFRRDLARHIVIAKGVRQEQCLPLLPGQPSEVGVRLGLPLCLRLGLPSVDRLMPGGIVPTFPVLSVARQYKRSRLVLPPREDVFLAAGVTREVQVLRSWGK